MTAHVRGSSSASGRPLHRSVWVLTVLSFAIGIALCLMMYPLVGLAIVALLDPTGGPVDVIGIAALMVFAGLLTSVALMLPRKTAAVGHILAIVAGILLTLFFTLTGRYTYPNTLGLAFALLAPALVVLSGTALVLRQRSKRLAQKRRAPDAAA